MQQAILITAYKNEKQILDIINYLGEDFEFYIHIDKKSLINLSEIGVSDNVHIFKEYIVNWGSFNHLKAILLLANKAIEDKRNVFFHLITGQDFPTKTRRYLMNELDTTKNYLEYFEIPAACWSGNGENGGTNRLEYYQPYEIFDCKSFIGNLLIRILVKTQKIVNIKRKVPYNIFHKLYGGSTYWSLTRDSLQYVLEFTDKNRKALERMRFTYCSEEIYFQSILLNSQYAKNTVNDNLRYVDWITGRGGNPAFLDMTDYEKIKDSNKLFARKFHEKDSEELRKKLIDTNVKN